MSSITIVSSEFGTFLNPNDREMVDVLVDLWDGRIEVWKKATKTSGTDEITNPWINLIACTTPAWIQGNFPEYMIGGGFTSRTIFVYAENKRHLSAYPAENFPPEASQQKQTLIRDLEYIATTVMGQFVLSKAAIKWGTDWYEKLYERNKDTLATDRFASYVARKQTHLHKLAMVMSAAYKDTRVLEAGDLQAAEGQLLLAEEHQHQVFSRIVAPEARPASLVLDTMQRRKAMTWKELFNSCFSSMSRNQFEEAVTAGVEAGLLKVQQMGHEKFVYLIEKKKESEKDSVSKSN